VAEGRSVSAVFKDIVRDLQDMVRSEIHLAKVEIREDVRQAVSSSVWLAAGAVGILSAWVFVLWTLAYALATSMPIWAATLVIAVVMAAVGAVLVMGGLRRVRRLQAIPERTVASLKENLEWIKQPTK
jgi:uncharacterized membrane protein YqjE